MTRRKHANKPLMRAMQELRRSNAASPHRNKRKYRRSKAWRKEW